MGFVRGMNIDKSLFLGLLVLAILGLVVLYSASGQDWATMNRQIIRLTIAFVLMLLVAQIPPHQLAFWTPWFFGLGLLLLLAVLAFGDVGKGAQRWLNLGIFRFQPSELMKIVVPMMVAWYFSEKGIPPKFTRLLGGIVIIMIPVVLIAKQPDLGTALLIGAAGGFVLFFTGISWWLIGGFIGIIAAAAPLVWFNLMHSYQRQRVLTFLNPETDPLGSGYHIIQSKIAIGSGGVFGKGWLNGTQSQLDFLPERSTDFIFAVIAEEFGFLGILVLLSVFLFIILRGIRITFQAQDTYTRLLSGSIVLTFMIYLFVNVGMVSGLLPVVGVPLPLISYGGTSVVTLMIAFGILMSIHTHRKLLPS
ncbi:MAG: rod shape-determining protein RodA [Gammaproteobacteria bacterium]|nr:rod shape-determining protein RodA [Gammaproteobacteria bacterium]MDH5692292.1 rod shape-determining protein RodA [Gammaproteobacteria bacterium]